MMVIQLRNFFKVVAFQFNSLQIPLAFPDGVLVLQSFDLLVETNSCVFVISVKALTLKFVLLLYTVRFGMELLGSLSIE